MSTDPKMTASLAVAPALTLGDAQRPSLCDVLDRVLNKGAVIDGEATISVAGIDLCLPWTEAGTDVHRDGPPQVPVRGLRIRSGNKY